MPHALHAAERRALLRGLLPLLLLLLLLAAACQREADPPQATLARCPALLDDTSLPTTPEAAAEARQANSSWTDDQIRLLYVCRAWQIGALNAGWVKEGLPPKERALRAFTTRKNARATARAMMSDPDAVRLLEARDREKYGDPLGPTFDWLVQRNRDKGLEGDAIYEAIIDSAQRTNAEVNAAAGL